MKQKNEFFYRNAMNSLRRGEPLSTADLQRLLIGINETDDILAPFELNSLCR